MIDYIPVQKTEIKFEVNGKQFSSYTSNTGYIFVTDKNHSMVLNSDIKITVNESVFYEDLT